MIYKKKCKICGKEFETDKVNKTICNDIHYTKCVICGNSVELKKYSISKYLKGHKFTCSKRCATELMKQTNIIKYGNPCSAQNKEIREEIVSEFNKKYGGNSPFCSKDIQNKSLEKRKHKSDKENQLIKQKVKETNRLRYGNENYNNQEKFKQTMQNKYGINYTNESLELKTKQQNTMIKRYGVPTALNKGPLRDKIDQIILQKYGTRNFASTPKAIATCMKKYGVPYYCMTEECRKLAHTPISQNNLKFKEKLEQLGYEVQLEFAINNFQYDLKVNNILIEIDPTFTHNSFIGPKFSNDSIGKPKDKNYHYIKTKNAIDNNYRCIHIFDWDNIYKILRLFYLKTNIYARFCDIKEVSKEDCSNFLNKYHLQNTCKGQTIRLGLYYKDELIEIMTFGRPRYNKKFQYELLRLCTKSKYQVIGGTQKLFKYFLEEYNPNSIISYCDLSKFSGDVYDKLGFKLKNRTNPSCHWSKGDQMITNNLLLQRGYDQLFGTNFGKGTSNEQLMIENGWLPVYDCGQAVYQYIK